MSTNTLSVLPRSQQHLSSAFGGVLVANKPVTGGFLADGRPSGALFYWSHSRFTDDFQFGLHDHQGFEIITFVLEGANLHFDTAGQQWVALRSGDVQIIRSGSGISHDEKVERGTRAFQIWFDPGFRAALERQPSYTDHPAAQFSALPIDGGLVADLVGGAGPVVALTEGLRVRRVALGADASVALPTAPGTRSVAYVIAGDVTVDGSAIGADDVVTVEGDGPMHLHAATAADVFVVSLPLAPSYEPVRQR